MAIDNITFMNSLCAVLSFSKFKYVKFVLISLKGTNALSPKTQVEVNILRVYIVSQFTLVIHLVNWLKMSIFTKSQKHSCKITSKTLY